MKIGVLPGGAFLLAAAALVDLMTSSLWPPRTLYLPTLLSR